MFGGKRAPRALESLFQKDDAQLVDRGSGEFFKANPFNVSIGKYGG